ncbi:C6 transcription factor [Colletotrichum plurivorum]|uniref:C6 transcription factor n=1 Tax=Colletotrichum plurivorum TaxID=2175906 RepID=A0A8H6NHJ7_9PEZI|nr:C6 transcription factor [Colletotrichum plurivorum]
MSSNLLNFNKPCNGCRRRKVKCDKEKPCNNCVRHGIACVYDAQREPTFPTPESQQQLQDRVDRLEKVIEEMKAMSIRGEPLKVPTISFPSASPASLSDCYGEEPIAGDPGLQVYEDNVSFYLGPNYWLNLQDVVYEPRCLFRIDSDATGKNPDSPTAWPIGRNPTLADLSHLHLDHEKEDILTELFFAHVEPFVRICHSTYWRQQITDFRVGVGKVPIDVEAAMFTTQAMTVAAMPANVILERLGKTKDQVLQHLQEASQLALERADVHRSRKPLALLSLLYHIQMKFIVGDGESAVILLGLAGRFGTRLGLHRDPGHYSYSPWACNMRRRIWAQFEVMDNPLYNLEGAESGLSFISDVQPPKNANDSQWAPTPFAKPGSTPADADGITDMSFVLVRSCLLKTLHSITKRRNEANPDELRRIVDQTDSFLKTKFMNHVDATSPIQALLLSYYRGGMQSIVLLVKQVHAQYTDGQTAEFCAKFYHECVEILEEMERGEAIAVRHNWAWLYRWPTTPCTLSNVLIGLAQQPKHPITDRAWRQVNLAFRRHNNADISMRKFAAWRVVEALCDQAMLYHKQRSHEGAWYAQRLDESQPATIAKGKIPVSLENATVDDILGDVQMFEQETNPHGGALGGSGYFAAQQPLHPMGYPTWDQAARHPGQSPSQTHHQPSRGEEEMD